MAAKIETLGRIRLMPPHERAGEVVDVVAIENNLGCRVVQPTGYIEQHTGGRDFICTTDGLDRFAVPETHVGRVGTELDPPS